MVPSRTIPRVPLKITCRSFTGSSVELRKQNGPGFEKPSRSEFHSAEEVIGRAPLRAAIEVAEFEATLDALAEGSRKLPVLPPEATRRAGIYRDHIRGGGGHSFGIG
jgi:hypothetical protein